MGVMHPSTGGTTTALHLTVRRHLLIHMAVLRLLMDLRRLALLRPLRCPQTGTTMAERGVTTGTLPRKPTR